jgi:hypothetical protein
MKLLKDAFSQGQVILDLEATNIESVIKKTVQKAKKSKTILRLSLLREKKMRQRQLGTRLLSPMPIMME